MFDFNIFRKNLAEAGGEVLGAFGITAETAEESAPDDSNVTVNVLVGVTHDIKGNVAFKSDRESAYKIISGMCGGMEVTELNEMTQSAICEFMNMLCGSTVCKTAAEIKDLLMDISPPVLITGDNCQVKFNASPVRTLTFKADGIKFDIAYSLEENLKK